MNVFSWSYFCRNTFWSNIWSSQLHLIKLKGELDSETSELFWNHPNFPCPFCTKIFDEKAELVKHLDTCDGTEDLSAVTLLSVMRKLVTILTTSTSTSFMILHWGDLLKTILKPKSTIFS